MLAILGGRPVLDRALAPYRSMGDAELRAVQDVVRSDVLSGYYGSAGERFLGGPVVRQLEEAWSARFGVSHAVSVNSGTSGLFAAMGAAGVSPGDEVIVPPYSMSASAMAPLVYGGVPVFVDIEPETFSLDVAAVRAAITPRTRAVLVVNLFGHPGRLAELRALADDRGIVLIEDNAQGVLAEEHGRPAGTVGHIGVFSLNYHKHIHAGEGGMCVTNDDRLAWRLRLIRNHGENVVGDAEPADLVNLIGFNYRMTELSAAVALAQLRHVDAHVAGREAVGHRLTAAVRGLEGLTPPTVRQGCRHVFYVWALRVDEERLGVPRARFSAALDAEGFPHFRGYVAPLYRLPVFQRRVAFGAHGFPFTLTDRHYTDVRCPTVERMYERELIGFESCAYTLDDVTVDALGEALRKVHAGRHELARWTGAPSPGQ
ncbi:MAG: DegT/DnrJ/EryC1/StrS family aminotransferase [Vicinamibacterales bacterium]